METATPLERDSLKMVYQEIVEGCSPSPKGFFIKHLCELEHIEVTRKRFDFINAYVAQGIPTEAERLKHLKESEEWTEEKEADIVAYRLTISDNEKMFSSVIPQQQPAILQLLEDNKKALRRLLMEKRQLIGTTAEEMAEKDSTSYLIFLSLFKDRACQNALFTSWDEFEAQEEIEIEGYIRAVDDVLGRIQELTIRKISALPFFLNSFSYCKENITVFLNRPISRLTNYQIHLFSLGTRNLNILTQAEGSPPEYFENVTAEEIIKWYDVQYSMILGRRKQAQVAQNA